MAQMKAIGILADGGKPSADVISILEGILTDIEHGTDDDGTETLNGMWPDVGPVEMRIETIPMSRGGDVMLTSHAHRILDARGWRRFVYITDLPLTAWERPVVSQRARDPEAHALLISLPAMGAFGATGRLRRELVSVIEDDVLLEGVVHSGPDNTEKEESDHNHDVETRVLDRSGRNLRLIAGMVRGNQPGRLLPVLSSSLAAMAATGGFGIFYGSIWKLAEDMSFPRLIVVSVFAVVSFTVWLIVHNRLWQRRHTQESRWRERVDNLATIGTILLTVLILYLLVMAVMGASAMVIIPESYLERELGRTVGLPTYLSIAWLSASLGAMAGALGSNFDREVEIRSATYNLREYERRVQAGNYVEKDSEGRPQI